MGQNDKIYYRLFSQCNSKFEKYFKQGARDVFIAEGLFNIFKNG